MVKCFSLLVINQDKGDLLGKLFLLCSSLLVLDLDPDIHRDWITSDDDSVNEPHPFSYEFSSVSTLDAIIFVPFPETWARKCMSIIYIPVQMHTYISTYVRVSERERFTLQAMEQKRLGKSWICRPQAASQQMPPPFVFELFASFSWGLGFKWTAFSPFILYACKTFMPYLITQQPQTLDSLCFSLHAKLCFSF